MKTQTSRETAAKPGHHTESPRHTPHMYTTETAAMGANRGAETTLQRFQQMANSSPHVRQLKRLTQMISAEAHMGRDRKPNHTGSDSSKAIVQRAVKVGSRHMGRTFPEETLKKLGLNPTQLFALEKMHAERDKIYSFTDEQHMVNFLQGKAGVAAPVQASVSPGELEIGHEAAEAIRHSKLYKPATSQFGDHAPGAHQVPDKQLPPSGPSHVWAKTGNGNKAETTLWESQFAPPAFSTVIRTFGDTDNPSIFTSQGKYNMGMRVQPAKTNFKKYSRSSGFTSTLAHLKSEKGRVRGHPLAVEQTQYSTDPADKSNFDDNPMLYTNESDGTIDSGFSTFRYSQIEKPAINKMAPFNQVNISSSPQTNTSMGIPMTDEIRLVTRHTGTDQELVFDNASASGYGAITATKKKKHTVLLDHVRQPLPSYPFEKIVKRIKTSSDPLKPSQSQFEERLTVAGWESPPPSPMLAYEPTTTAVLPGRKHQNEEVTYQGGSYYVDEVSYDSTKNESSCGLKKLSWDKYE